MTYREAEDTDSESLIIQQSVMPETYVPVTVTLKWWRKQEDPYIFRGEEKALTNTVFGLFSGQDLKTIQASKIIENHRDA